MCNINHPDTSVKVGTRVTAVSQTAVLLTLTTVGSYCADKQLSLNVVLCMDEDDMAVNTTHHAPSNGYLLINQLIPGSSYHYSLLDNTTSALYERGSFEMPLDTTPTTGTQTPQSLFKLSINIH